MKPHAADPGCESAMPARTVALAVVGLIVGWVLFAALSPNRYVPFIPHRSEFVLFLLSLGGLFALFNFTRRLPWWVATPLFAVAAFVFLVTWPLH